MSRTFITTAERQATFIIHALLLMAVLFSASVQAADSAGRLLFVRGEVQIASVDAEPRAANRGDVLQVGDTIRTGANSNAQLRMSDGAMISLKAGTEFRIEAQDYNKNAPGEGSQVGELLRGGLRVITGAIGHEKPEAVKYRTPVATIGIRGTVFDTIYIPPEGLPELPGMAPGTYLLVLEGQVLLSTSTGELLLGPGEVGYVPFVDALPELRPDLSAIFVEFASFEEKDRPKTSSGTVAYSRTVLGLQQATRSIDTVLAEQLFSNTAVVTQGPYGIANVGVGLNTYQGDFFGNPVTLTPGDELYTATGGTGEISSYQLIFNNGAINAGSATAGDSTVNWGQYSGTDVQLFDQGNIRIGASTELINYITATNVIVSTADLPTVGSYTYNYVVGSGTGEPLLAGSNLIVDFGTARMDVTLVVGLGDYKANNQAISSFYGTGIALTDPVFGGNNSSISGRFVGSAADGAVAGYILDLTDGYVLGTAVFAR